LPRFKWADHALLAHAADPVVRFNSHGRIVKPSLGHAHYLSWVLGKNHPLRGVVDLEVFA
jgi:hypothetical protein